MAIWYVDPEFGNDANAGTSLATAWKTLAASTAAKGVVNGDTIRVKASDTTIQSIGTCAWTYNNQNVTIPAGTIKNIDMCETAWTGSANVTSGITTTVPVPQGTNRLNISIAAGFTTGKVAYKALGSTEDFSAYQQVSFFVQSNTTVANCFYLALCSDTTGDVIVNTIPFNTVHLGVAGRWHSYAIDNLSALGSSIQSVALYASSDPGTCTISLDNIIACKAPSDPTSLTLRDLIGLNLGSIPEWFPIKSINGNTLELGIASNWTGNIANAAISYVTNGNYDTYRMRGAIELTSNTQLGAAPLRVNVSGGWNRTDMSTQVGYTWFNTQTAFWQLVNPTIDTLYTIGSFYNLQGVGIGSVENLAVITPRIAMSALSGNFQFFYNYKNCYFSSIQSNFPNIRGGKFENCRFFVDVSGSFGNSPMEFIDCEFRGANSISNFAYGGENTGAWLFTNCVFKNIALGVVPLSKSERCTFYYEYLTSIPRWPVGTFNDCTFVNLTFASFIGYSPTSDGGRSITKITKYNGNSNDNFYQRYNTSVKTVADSNRRTASGIAYKINGTGMPEVPMQYKIATPYVAAGSTVTVKAWVKGQTINSSYPLKARLVAPAQLGVTAKTIGAAATFSNTTAPPNTNYTQIQISFTPIVSGVAEIYIEGFSDPNPYFSTSPVYTVLTDFGSIWLDDIEIS